MGTLPLPTPLLPCTLPTLPLPTPLPLPTTATTLASLPLPTPTLPTPKRSWRDNLTNATRATRLHSEKKSDGTRCATSDKNKDFIYNFSSSHRTLQPSQFVKILSSAVIECKLFLIFENKNSNHTNTVHIFALQV